ncbi:MAG: peptidylprolyl isomerase [Bacteroidetes bacterium]|nr:peptidylprolyl isomerase [Bacteroidota bacterium]
MKYIFLILALLVTNANSQSKKVDKVKGKIMEETKNGNTKVLIQTSKGDITIELFEKEAPKHSANFIKLANENYYEGTTFHRVIPGFMIQGGDPNSKDDDRSNDGAGGPDYKVDAEIGMTHERGVIAAARQGDGVNPLKQSSGSQFYITVVKTPSLDGQYSVFGKVTSGMEIADKIVSVPRDQRDNPFDKIVITKVTFLK